jgi:hypothetical protein
MLGFAALLRRHHDQFPCLGPMQYL